MGHWTNGWKFVTAGHAAATPTRLEEIFIELNRVGFDGAVSASNGKTTTPTNSPAAKTALANCRRIRPSAIRHEARRDAQGLTGGR